MFLSDFLMRVAYAMIGGIPAILIVIWLKSSEKIDIFDVSTNFNPFKVALTQDHTEEQPMFIKMKERHNIPPDSLYVEYKCKDPKNKRPTLILLPGGPGGDHSIYAKQIDVFFKWVDVVIFDPRGCGKSSLATPACYSMDVYIDDVEDIREQLELDDIVILGTSYGSMAAQGYAVKYGKKVGLKALVLVAGAPSYEFIESARLGLLEIGSSEQIETFDCLLAGRITTDEQLREYFKVMAPLYSTSTRNGETFHSAKKDVHYNADAALAGFGPDGFLRMFDWRNELPAIACPTCIIVGEEDWINQTEQAEEMQKLIPQSNLVIIKESGHFVWVDQKEKYLSVVTDFLSASGTGLCCTN
jgi:proline iminopeptidase